MRNNILNDPFEILSLGDRRNGHTIFWLSVICHFLSSELKNQLYSTSLTIWKVEELWSIRFDTLNTYYQYVKDLINTPWYRQYVKFYPKKGIRQWNSDQLSSQPIKLKYIVNYAHAIFNYETKKYETDKCRYNSLTEAKANRWKCEKCQYRVGTYKKLILHKNEYHSYWLPCSTHSASIISY